MMLPGAPPDPETLPSLGPVLAPAPPCLCSQGSGGGPGAGWRGRSPCPLVSQHMEPLGPSTKTLNLFCFTFFPNNCWEKNLNEILGVGLRGWVGDLGGYELGLEVDQNIPD